MKLPTQSNDNIKPAKLLRYCDLAETRGITFTRRHLYTLENERKFPRRSGLPTRPFPRFDGGMWRPSITVILCLLADQAIEACGDRGGPGYRSPSGRCVGWADIGKTCGNPPSTRCTAERAANGAEAAAELGQKAWDAGKDARKAAGRTD